MRRNLLSTRTWRLGGCLLAAAAWVAPSPLDAAGPPKRARPPQFPKRVTDVFLPDAREALVGPAPDARQAQPTDPAPDRQPGDAKPNTIWPTLISAEAVEDEIKAQQLALGAALKNAVTFKAGEHKAARTHLSVLAVLMAVDADFGEPMRWQREAPAMRDLLASAARNCKAASDGAYREAKARGDDVASLVRGTFESPASSEPRGEWNQVADRSELMKRLEQALQRLEAGTANQKGFGAQSGKLEHEAQIVAALAEVIGQEGYEFADDDGYREDAIAMRDGATEARAAIERKDHEATRAAVSAIGKTCTHCHEGYRN
jgi:cytochrome c556